MGKTDKLVELHRDRFLEEFDKFKETHKYAWAVDRPSNDDVEYAMNHNLIFSYDGIRGLVNKKNELIGIHSVAPATKKNRLLVFLKMIVKLDSPIVANIYLCENADVWTAAGFRGVALVAFDRAYAEGKTFATAFKNPNILFLTNMPLFGKRPAFFKNYNDAVRYTSAVSQWQYRQIKLENLCPEPSRIIYHGTVNTSEALRALNDCVEKFEPGKYYEHISGKQMCVIAGPSSTMRYGVTNLAEVFYKGEYFIEAIELEKTKNWVEIYSVVFLKENLI